MLVYCSHLAILSNTTIEDILVPASKWLSKKLMQKISAESLLENDTRVYSDSSRLEVASNTTSKSELLAIRYSHPDKRVRGRYWFTEIGVRRDGKTFDCSILLRTEETSTLVTAFTNTTRPGIVQAITADCKLSSNCRGGGTRPLTLADVDAFDYLVHDPLRDYPLIQVSCTRDGAFPVDQDYLASLLVGIGEVIVIPTDVDTFELENRLGARFSCFHGAVNIIWPMVRSSGNEFVPSSRLMATDLLTWRSEDQGAEGFILAKVCQRTNPPFSRRHLTPEIVQSLGLRDAMDAAKTRGAAFDNEFAELVRKVDHDQQAEIQRLGKDLANAESDYSVLQDKFDRLKETNESLKQSLDAASRSAKMPASTVLTSENRRLIMDAIVHTPTIEDALKLLLLFFPDRIVVLDDAWKSARDAIEFRETRAALDLLVILCGDYWESLCAGEGDAAGRRLFGKSFSAKESESVEKNRKACGLRTFFYKKRPIEMMKHLKIGTKPSRHETWRCHFEWDASDKKIVLGHCGEHLDQG